MTMIYLPCLDYIMQKQGCTNEALAKAAGLSRSTIVNARRGKSIRQYNALLILQTLKERKFNYKSRAGLNRLRRSYT